MVSVRNSFLVVETIIINFDDGNNKNINEFHELVIIRWSPKLKHAESVRQCLSGRVTVCE